MANTVKVSGNISASQHARLSAVAARHKTTIGNLIAFAIARVLHDVEDGAEDLKIIRRDKRRTNGAK